MVHQLARLRHGWLLPLLPLLALAIAAGALVACGSDDNDSTPTAAASTATRAATSESAAATPTAGGNTLNISVKSGDKGDYLAGPNGKALYVFTKDADNKSNCTGQCATNWPALMETAGQQVKADAKASGEFGSIDTAAGKQVTYNEAPLYEFAGDAAPTDTNGHLVGGVWFLARPDIASVYVIGIREDGPKTPYLVGPTGMTLYTFDRDTAGTSNCTGQCITNWPALTVPEGQDPTAADDATGELGVFVRDDGKRQVTYKGAPVYYYQADKLPADTTGDGVGGVWHIATP